MTSVFETVLYELYVFCTNESTRDHLRWKEASILLGGPETPDHIEFRKIAVYMLLPKGLVCHDTALPFPSARLPLYKSLYKERFRSGPVMQVIPPQKCP